MLLSPYLVLDRGKSTFRFYGIEILGHLRTPLLVVFGLILLPNMTLRVKHFSFKKQIGGSGREMGRRLQDEEGENLGNQLFELLRFPLKR